MNIHLDALWLTAIATTLYGGATFALVIQQWRDRVQREKHFREESESRKLDELHRAFFEAYGYWIGHYWAAGSVPTDAAQVGRQFEAVTRLECQLRLNGYRKEAHDLGLATRTGFDKVREELAHVGVAIKLLPSDYRAWSASNFADRGQ
jgi:hypothetical protein